MKVNGAKEGIDKSYSEYLLLGALLSLIAIIGINSPNFFSANNLRNILDQASYQLILSLGMSFVIASRGIDLSIGSIVSLTGIVTATMLSTGFSIAISIINGLLVAILLGMLNGLIISYFKMAPFVATIGTMNLYRGMSLIITGGRPIYGLPDGFTSFSRGNYQQLNPPIFLSLFLVILAYLILKWTQWGKYILTIGSNEKSLSRVGVNTSLYKVSVYAVSGFLAGIVGLMMVSKLNAAEPNAGLMLESDVIAAVILGGTTMKGGKASIVGTLLASLLIAILKNGLTLLSISSYYQQFFI